MTVYSSGTYIMPRHSSGPDVELHDFSSTSPRTSSYNLWTATDEHRESEPLIASSSSSSNSREGTPPHVTRHRNHDITLDSTRDFWVWNLYQQSEKEYFLLDFIMKKIKSSKLRYVLDKIAVESEPGLTNAQLMLTNHDLKPVEPERRQWGAWNFVGFWIGKLNCSMAKVIN
jgi:hypothetical protein